MNSFRKLAVAVALGCVAALAGQAASAHGAPPRRHSSVSFGLYFGAPYPVGPFYRPFGWPAPYYAYPYPAPVVVVPAVPAAPPVYVEQPPPVATVPPPNSAPPAAQRNNEWYWCGPSQAYYPYVNQCSEPWQRVPAR